MSNSTKAFSEQIEDVVNPNKNLELDEEELAEIYSRPYMNPDHARLGCDPHSNRILAAEKQTIENKTEKC